MNPCRRISRRTMLQGVGAVVALPLLDVMCPAAGRTISGSATTPRMAYFYFPNGIPRGTWTPAQVAADGKLLRLNKWMSPLEPFKDDLIIPTNIWTPLGNGHGSGTATWLTGRDYDHRRVHAGISVDQVAAAHVGRDTLLPSLELSLKGEGFFSNSLPRNTLSWSGAGMPMTREIEPRVIFDRMFRPPSGGATNRPVMEMVLEEARSLQRYVSAADRQRLDQYFESIHALEKRIEFAERQTSEIGKDRALTDTLTAPEPGIPSDHEEYMRLMMDLVVMAFQSDATRVCTFMLDHGQSNRYFNFIDNVTGTWHALSHYKDASGMTEDDDGKISWKSVKQKRAMFAEVHRWHHRQMAYLLSRLKDIHEPDGRTLLDNSMIVYGSSLGDGHEHDEHHLPTIIAGRGRGTIKAGRQIKFAKPKDLGSVHLALLQLMGITLDRFGTATTAMDELAG